MDGPMTLSAKILASHGVEDLTPGSFALARIDRVMLNDVSGAVSYADALGSSELQRYRLAGLLLFYGVSYLTHPLRPLRSLYNIATRRYESRMEMSFGNLVRRLSTQRARTEVA